MRTQVTTLAGVQRVLDVCSAASWLDLANLALHFVHERIGDGGAYDFADLALIDVNNAIDFGSLVLATAVELPVLFLAEDKDVHGLTDVTLDTRR